MTRASGPLSLLVLLGALACEGRDVVVFDLQGGGGPASAGGPTGGRPGSTDSSGSPPAAAGSDAGLGGSLGASGAANDGGDAAGTAGSGALTAGTGGGGPRLCTENADCGPGWACERDGCNVPTGECVPFDAFCSPDPAPVCGCNGISYWNDCLRINAGAQLAGPGQCKGNACRCEVGADCGVPNASCSHLLPPGAMCGHGQGACWVLPAGCPPGVDPKLFRECKPTDQGVPGACVGGCKAIASERSYVELRHGETCD